MKARASPAWSWRVEEEFSWAEAGEASSAGLTLLRVARGVVCVSVLLRAADEKRFLSVSLLALREVVKSSSSDVSQVFTQLQGWNVECEYTEGPQAYISLTL